VDYGHNAAALAAMGRLVHDTWGGDPVAAVTLPGDRRDDLVTETAASIAAWFGRVVVYEDADLRGRRAGQMTELIRAGLNLGRPGMTIVPATGPEDALRCALALACPSDPVLLLYEKFGPVKDLLTAFGATPWQPGSTMPPALPATWVSRQPTAPAGPWPSPRARSGAPGPPGRSGSALRPT
jgi:cyanophycin synthetase